MIPFNINQKQNNLNQNMNQGVNQIVVIKEKALQIVRTRGPLLPVQITKELGINVMFASALLSELVDSKTLKLSNTKIGGSPVYYVAGQEPKLQSLRDKLNDKQQKAFDMLKQNKVLRDSEQEPVIRLALRDIKDFAHRLHVTLGNYTEVFWKWYLVSDSEAEPLIKQKLSMITKKEPVKADVQKQLEEVENDLKRLEKREPVKAAEKIEIPVKKIKVRKQKTKIVEEQAVLPQEKAIDENDRFMMKVAECFKKDGIEIITVKQVRKNKDFEGTIKIPSAVGSIMYFFKAKDKKSITDSDLSLLFVQSQMKKMPILLVTTGNMTKKAQELLNKEFKNIAIKSI